MYAAIERFVAIVGCQPIFVFDRGFACPAIIKYMAKQDLRFIIHIKKRKRFHSSGNYAAEEDLGANDLTVEGYALPLRLIVSDIPKRKKGKEGDNDP